MVKCLLAEAHRETHRRLNPSHYAAIVTHVGAPLSHGAIIARELGIPAVVNCGDATTRLKTGDRVCVDGAAGVVELLEPR